MRKSSNILSKQIWYLFPYIVLKYPPFLLLVVFSLSTIMSLPLLHRGTSLNNTIVKFKILIVFTILTTILWCLERTFFTYCIGFDVADHINNTYKYPTHKPADLEWKEGWFYCQTLDIRVYIPISSTNGSKNWFISSRCMDKPWKYVTT